MDKAQSSDEPALAGLRDRIDALDERILALLNERAQIAIEVGDVKRAADAAPQFFRPEREAQVIRRSTEVNAGPLPPEAVAYVFREVMSACRALEHTAVVAYLGPEGTYSEQAVIRRFGRSVERRGCASIDEIFRELEAKAADFGVNPIEH